MKSRDRKVTPCFFCVMTVMLLGEYLAPLALAEGETKAVERIRQLGGTVIQDNDRVSSGIFLDGNSDEEIESVDFSVFQGLRLLTISSRHMTTKSIAAIRKVPSLLSSLSITAEKQIDARELGGLLRRQNALGRLSLNGTSFTDQSLRELEGLQNLRCLCLNETRITDAGLKDIGALQRLISLQLAETSITDEGLGHIAQLPNIIGLVLRRTKVTDAGIADLCRMQFLDYLNVAETKITEAGRKTLQIRFPGLKLIK